MVFVDILTKKEALGILYDFLIEYHPDDIKILDELVKNRKIFSSYEIMDNGEIEVVVFLYTKAYSSFLLSPLAIARNYYLPSYMNLVMLLIY